MKLFRIQILLLIIISAQSLFSFSFQESDKNNPIPPSVLISKEILTPKLDGLVIDDPAYFNSKVLNQFWQTTPNEGTSSSENTEVRLLYTEDTLYVGVICFDREPEKIIASEKKRDGILDETDAFQIILDTFNDKQNGFIFGTNPVGLEYDAQVTNEGEISAVVRRSGSTGGFNLNWDASWIVKTSIGNYGWSAEFAIPFKTLRYTSGKNQEWGLNFQRNICRHKEISYWSKLPRQFNLNRVSLAGTLHGLEIKTPQNLKLIPYALGKSQSTISQSSKKNNGDGGIDLKYSITPSITLDATYNTDFAQVEVDEQQVNLDRFDLFFPEKRPFFLENAGFFDVGSPGEVEFFFSRRIGIASSGTAVPIVVGGRLTGKIGTTNFGLLNMQTSSVGESIPDNNFSVIRVSENLPNRSNIGFLAVNRQATGNSEEDNFNRLIAVDGKLGIGLNTQLSAYAGKTISPNISGDQHAFRVGMMHNSEEWMLENFYTEVAHAFNPEVGFLKRNGYRKFETLIYHRYRPENFFSLHELRPHITYRTFWDMRTGFLESATLHIDNHWEFKNGHEFHTATNIIREGVESQYTIYDDGNKKVFVPAGSYNQMEAAFVLMTNQGLPISFNIMSNIGEYFGGSRISANPSLRYRASKNLTLAVSSSYNKVKLPGGNFTTNVLRGKLQYYFSPHMFVQGLLQYNDVTKEFSTNARFGWLDFANTGLYAVFNELYDENAIVPGRQNRSVIIKYSYLFDVLN